MGTAGCCKKIVRFLTYGAERDEEENNEYKQDQHETASAQDTGRNGEGYR